MKKLIVAIFAMFMFVGCGSDPESVAKKWIEAAYNGDTKTVVAELYLTENEMKDESLKPQIEGKMGMVVGEAVSKAKKHGGFKKVEVLSKEVNEDSATIKMKSIFKDGTEESEGNMKLRKNHKGDWKITLN